MEEDRIPEVLALLKRLSWCGKYRYNPLLKGEAPPLRWDDKDIFWLFRNSSRPWFARRGLLQEVHVGHNVTLHCGKHKLVWEWSPSALNHLSKLSATQTFNFDRGAVNQMVNVSTIRTESEDLHEQPWKYHSAKCPDLRDRFFALYGAMRFKGSTKGGGPYLDWHCHLSNTFLARYGSFAGNYSGRKWRIDYPPKVDRSVYQGSYLPRFRNEEQLLETSMLVCASFTVGPKSTFVDT